MIDAFTQEAVDYMIANNSDGEYDRALERIKQGAGARLLRFNGVGLDQIRARIAEIEKTLSGFPHDPALHASLARSAETLREDLARAEGYVAKPAIVLTSPTGA